MPRSSLETLERGTLVAFGSTVLMLMCSVIHKNEELFFIIGPLNFSQLSFCTVLIRNKVHVLF